MTTPLWDPAEILQFEPNSLGLTCIGHAKTQGRRCDNPIADANRQQAAKILLEMARLDPRSPRVDFELEELASCLLCRKWHQDQAGAIKRQWRRDILNHQDFETAPRAERSRIVERPVTPARAPFIQTRVRATRREMVTSSITTSVTRESSSVTIVSIVIREESSEIGTNAPDEEAEIPRQQTNQEAHPSSQRQDITDHQADGASPESSFVEPTGHTTAPSVVVQDTPATEEPQQEPASEAEPAAPISSAPDQTRQSQHQDSHPANHDRRAIEGKCAICCEAFSPDSGDTTRCRAQCRQNFHAECIDLWHASQRRINGRKFVRIGEWSLMRDTCVNPADIGAVARNGPTEMVLLLLLCCGGNARVLLALIAWILFLVTRVAAVLA